MATNMMGTKPHNNAEWKKAWDSISRLANARRLALREMAIEKADATTNAFPLAAPAESAVEASAPADPDEYARAIAEIEQASAVLRQTEPNLEAWRPDDAAATSETRKSRSVWLLIGGIWLSTVSAFAGAIGAILYLLG